MWAGRRNPLQPNVDVVQLVGNLMSSMESAHAAQQATSAALLPDAHAENPNASLEEEESAADVNGSDTLMKRKS